jgi:hypothetical protein
VHCPHTQLNDDLCTIGYARAAVQPERSMVVQLFAERELSEFVHRLERLCTLRNRWSVFTLVFVKGICGVVAR